MVNNNKPLPYNERSLAQILWWFVLGQVVLLGGQPLSGQPIVVWVADNFCSIFRKKIRKCVTPTRTSSSRFGRLPSTATHRERGRFSLTG